MAPNPSKYSGFYSYVRANLHRTLRAASGVEVLEFLEDPALDYSRPILPQRPRLMDMYGEGKAYLSTGSITLAWNVGFHDAVFSPIMVGVASPYCHLPCSEIDLTATTTFALSFPRQEVGKFKSSRDDLAVTLPPGPPDGDCRDADLVNFHMKTSDCKGGVRRTHFMLR